uniref:(northern house mosquito) hypothetical protein n=1 Tax=Culex pipiens TaxID=7175 RepID=A0A8D8G8M1_CULPI
MANETGPGSRGRRRRMVVPSGRSSATSPMCPIRTLASWMMTRTLGTPSARASSRTTPSCCTWPVHRRCSCKRARCTSLTSSTRTRSTRRRLRFCTPSRVSSRASTLAMLC